jgi:hypothetical protein
MRCCTAIRVRALWMLRYGRPTIRRFLAAGRLAKIGRLRTGEFVQILCDEIADEHYLVVDGHLLAAAQENIVRRLLGGDLT